MLTDLLEKYLLDLSPHCSQLSYLSAGSPGLRRALHTEACLSFEHYVTA